MGQSTECAVLALVAVARGAVARTFAHEVDGAVAQTFGYEVGPGVGNDALSLCSTEIGTLEQAASQCEADPSCRTLHDWNCDGENWRACSATISQLQEASSDTLACSQFRTFGYVYGPFVGNDAFSLCSTEIGTLEQAASQREADPSCHTLHDWNCDGENLRACSATISQLQAASSDALACSRVRPSTLTVKSMTTITATTSTASPWPPPVAYKLVTEGSDCARIMDIVECSAAAIQLGLAATTAFDDGRTGSIFDPPYCYYDSDWLKFNAGGSNTGSCSSSDNCLCSPSASCGHCVNAFTGRPDGCFFNPAFSACTTADGSEFCFAAGASFQASGTTSCTPQAPPPAQTPPPTPAPPPTPCCLPARRLEGAKLELAAPQPQLLVL